MRLLLFLFLVILLSGFAQGQHTPVNQYISIEKTLAGVVLVSNDGKKSTEYTYLYAVPEKGYVEAIIVIPSKDTIKKVRTNDRCGSDYYSNSVRRRYFIIDIMKDLGVIEDYSIAGFSGGDDETRYADYGYAMKKGKYALINWKGDLLTEFKYNNFLLNSYEEKRKTISVVLDKFTAQELFTTKDSIVRYWDPQNYLLKNKNGKYHLTFQSKRYKVRKEFRHIKDLPVESTFFTYNTFNFESGFMTLDEQKWRTNLSLSQIFIKDIALHMK